MAENFFENSPNKNFTISLNTTQNVALIAEIFDSTNFAIFKTQQTFEFEPFEHVTTTTEWSRQRCVRKSHTIALIRGNEIGN